MSHHHHHHGTRGADDVAMDRRFLATIVLNAVIAIAEFAGGIVAGSLAMLSDAAHNLGDVAAIVLALVARKLGRRPPTARHTYGFKRLEVMGALVNALLLVAVTVLIAREAIVRLLHPQPVAQGLMLTFGLLALGANFASVLLLRRHDKRDVNTRGAYLHMIQDVCASMAVVVAALFARTAAGPYIDSVLALVVCLLVLRSAVSLAWETFSTFLEGAPRDVDIARLADAVGSAFSPACLHHVHVWAISPNQRLLTAHVALGQEMTGSEIEVLLVSIKELLHRDWAINHCTLEPEVAGCGQVELLGRWDCVSPESCCGHSHPTNPNRSKPVASMS
jgi:cobalt-zinc-cadmium efflux system protein